MLKSLKLPTQIHEIMYLIMKLLYEPRCEKTGLRGFRPGLTQTRLYSFRRLLDAFNFGFRKWRGCTICVAKTKALISFAVTAKLVCVFVFAYAKSRFSHNEAHIIVLGHKQQHVRITIQPNTICTHLSLFSFKIYIISGRYSIFRSLRPGVGGKL